MINALNLKNNKKFIKKKMCDDILNDIEQNIIIQDNIGKYFYETKEYPKYIKELQGY